MSANESVTRFCLLANPHSSGFSLVKSPYTEQRFDQEPGLGVFSPYQRERLKPRRGLSRLHGQRLRRCWGRGGSARAASPGSWRQRASRGAHVAAHRGWDGGSPSRGPPIQDKSLGGGVATGDAGESWAWPLRLVNNPPGEADRTDGEEFALTTVHRWTGLADGARLPDVVLRAIGQRRRNCERHRPWAEERGSCWIAWAYHCQASARE